MYINTKIFIDQYKTLVKFGQVEFCLGFLPVPQTIHRYCIDPWESDGQCHSDGDRGAVSEEEESPPPPCECVYVACCQSNDIYMYILSKVVCMKSYIITLYILLSYFIILGCWNGGSIWSYLDVSCKSILARN